MELDPKRVRAALRRCEAKEAAAAELEREARMLRASAATIRDRWGLPPCVTNLTQQEVDTAPPSD